MSSTSADRPASVEIVLVKGGRTKISYQAELLADDGNRVVVRAPWAGDGVRDFGFVRFEKGDVFTEYYWRDRWYSVKEVRDAAGRRKGWYCDITRPADVHADRLVVEDLDLDLWRSADGTEVRRLDEDEFAESGLTRTDPAAAAAAEKALDDLELLAHEGGFEDLLA
ncbi:DUF402 domain-containing protein [Streptomyces aureus]|jgi:hypothetical protein|uniref:DUF402 domain-containing protein n=1 Tax=Streptomyces aureus TaxID=193461 RepID=UPI0036C2DEF8